MRPALTAALLIGLAGLAACQSKPQSVKPQSALDVMERVAVGANRCWFKSGDPVFSAYELAPELNSFSGKPRILLVRKGHSDIRPVLVVLAEGKPPKLSAFGPLMNEPVASRIAADVTRWAASAKDC